MNITDWSAFWIALAAVLCVAEFCDAAIKILDTILEAIKPDNEEGE